MYNFVMTFPRISTFKTATSFQKRLDELGLALPFDEQVDPELWKQPIPLRSTTVGNRFCILPMEGWDGTTDGKPSELTTRRWRNFGLSGAKLIWGGEAVAVRQDGRANPNQLLMTEANVPSLARLREELVTTHRQAFGNDDGLYVGLQLTHSGRFARPNEKKRLEPRIAYRHPLLDRKFGIDNDGPLLTDDDILRLIDQFLIAGKNAWKMGYQFVDMKHCHGYLGHEFLSAYDRPGRFGGSFENRTRFLRNIAEGLRAEAPGLDLAVRLSIFDMLPFQPGPDGTGVPSGDASNARYSFSGNDDGLGYDLGEATRFVNLLEQLGIEMVCASAGSPYYNPHMQRPALFPPSDGYQPPEDPLVGVTRQIEATAELKRRCPGMVIVGSAYSYLQEWLPNVGQAVMRMGGVDSIGLGRMVLSYPELPADVIAGRTLERKKICRTFSDCTTGPRNGLVSGCFPLDPFYKQHPDRIALEAIKR